MDGTPGRGSPGRVLVVDDDQLTRRVVIGMLEEGGFTALGAPGAEAGLDVVRAGGCDLVLADWIMPGIDGLGLLERIRALPGGGPPVLMLTAVEDDDHLALALDHGADDYLTKPVAASVLLARVRVALRTQRAIADAERERARSEAVLAAMLDGLAIIGADGRCLLATERLADMTGRTQAELEAALRPPWAADGEGDGVCEAVAAAASEGGGEVEAWLDRRGEGPFPAVLSVSPLALDGRAATVVTVKDVGDRHRAEARLRASEERFRSLIEGMSDVVYRYAPGPPARLEYVSPSVTALLGFTPEDLYADPGLLRRIVHPGDRPAFERIMRTGPGGSRGALVRWLARDGRVVWVEQRTRVEAGPDGVPVAVDGVAIDVTEREQAQAELRLERDYSHALVAAIQDGLGVVDGDGVILAVNERMSQVLGLPDREIVGQAPPYPWWPDDEREAIVAAFAHAQGSDEGTVEFEFVRGDGERFPAVVSWARRRDSRSGEGGHVFTIRDVAAERRSEERLRQGQAQYAALAENSPDAISRVDRDLRRVYVNRTWCRLSGLDRDEALGRDVGELPFATAEQSAEWSAAARRVVETGRRQVVVWRAEGEQGEMWHKTEYVPERDREGEVRHVLVVSRDITDIKRAEQSMRAVAQEQAALRRVAERIARGAEQVEVFAEAAGEAAGLVGADAGGVVRFGPGPEVEVMGAWRREGTATAAGTLVVPAPGSATAAVRATAAPCRRQAPDGLVTAAAPVRVGERVWGEIVALGRGPGAPAAGAEHRLRAFADALALAIETAEARAARARLEAELRQAQKLEAVGQLAAGVAHEINTPIQFVGDSVEFLRDAFADLADVLEAYRAAAGVREGPAALALAERAAALEAEIEMDDLVVQVPKAIDRTREGVDRVAEIVRAMRDFAHPSRGVMEDADLNGAVRSTLTVARNELKYVADVDADLGALPPVRCRVGDIKQLVLNLLLNAAHAVADRRGADGGRGHIGVATRIAAEGDAVEIEVADDGCGIPAANLERIFDPFFTTKEPGRGTGQGLAIVHRVVEDHDGRVEVRSREGEGTRMVVRLPLAPASDG